jgi:hypothetical protein
MKNKATPFGMLSLILLTLPVANAAVIQTNFGTIDGTTPGGAFVSVGNLLVSNLSSATSSGTFYNTLNLTEVYDGVLSLPNTNSGVMPTLATLQFNLNGTFNLSTIRTYASWGDTGRSGQGYEVKYATAADPGNFSLLYSVTPYNIQNDDEDETSTMVRLTSDNGYLAENVVSLQFVFNGYQNDGTGFREFQVLGSQVSSVPEPSTFLPAALLVIGAILRRRRGRVHRSGRAAA